VITSGQTMTIEWAFVPHNGFSGRKRHGYLAARDVTDMTDGWNETGWRIINIPPSTGGLNPAGGNAPGNSWVNFVARYSDGDGYDNIYQAFLLINDSLSQVNGIFVRYDRFTNKLYMRNDAGTSWIGGYAPGSNHQIVNSQAVLDCRYTGVIWTDDTLVIGWRIRTLSSFAGAKKTYLKVMDLMGEEDGWNQAGSWTVGGSSMLLEDYETLPLGEDFRLDIPLPPPDATSTPSKPVPILPPGPDDEIPKRGGTLHISEGIGLSPLNPLRPELVGRPIAIAATPPQNGKVMPDKGWITPTEMITITTTYSDPDGASDLAHVFFLMNTNLVGANSIYAWYNANANKLYLQSDNNTVSIGGYAPGTDVRLTNTQVTLDVQKTTVSTLGNTLTVNWCIVPKVPFSGRKRYVYLSCTDDGSLSASWQALGWQKLDLPPNTGHMIPPKKFLPDEQPTFRTTQHLPSLRSLH